MRGVFLERTPYTRLITYSRIEDMRATRETFPKVLPSDPGFATFDGNLTSKGDKRPWVYLGPGVFLDDDAHVHVRLSHTHNDVPLWDDYRGVTDPRLLKLGLSLRAWNVLTLRRCENVVIRDLSLRYGGEETVSIRACSDITLDGVRIRAASRAIRLDKDGNSTKGCERITLRNCRIDGGIPTWHFRSDRKDAYEFTLDGVKVTNNLGAATSAVCFSGHDAVPHSAVTVEHCEIVNIHDLAVFGQSPHYHHNLLDNINDDALVFIEGTTNARIHHNVMTRVLTALSFADSGLTGQISIYRNLIDLRTATLGVRPTATGSKGSLRQGQFYKGDGAEGPTDIFQNTCITLNPGMSDDPASQGNAAAYTHYKVAEGARRRAYNNVFVAIYTNLGEAKPIAFLPPQSFAGPSDGNVYHRIGAGSNVFLVPNTTGGFTPYANLESYRAAHEPYEDRGQLTDPCSGRWARTGSPVPPTTSASGPHAPPERRGLPDRHHAHARRHRSHRHRHPLLPPGRRLLHTAARAFAGRRQGPTKVPDRIADWAHAG